MTISIDPGASSRSVYQPAGTAVTFGLKITAGIWHAVLVGEPVMSN
jgi:hypothetical protein